ncbi:hypothetical protein MYAM1_001205 [Malassezia yamatoensis]|uniref:U3 small nucleolar RNA-associated protein 11 n=1 Tax=Malassezia yamatoensis TaxID=253288 RepID=A0AAJ5YRM0_9BASI|nr:hypothetical protein MYAM1_001205 [Malassezia yamatoensis]
MALRNHVQRRNHKERSQPENRKRFGLLEKHKDYVERARAHHVNRDKLKRLREKAANKNQDEFHTGMVGKKTERGIHVESRGNKALPNDVVALLKTQDAGYLRKQLVTERKRIAALKEQIAPRVAGMRLSWLERKPVFVTALEREGLLGHLDQSKATASTRGSTNERLQSFGQRTVWAEDVEDMKLIAKASKVRAPEQPVSSLEKTGERQLGFLIRELITRQHRIDALKEASQKLDTVRSLMSTKGSHAVPKKVVSELKEAVSKKAARITSKGLVIDADRDDEDEANVVQTKKQYKWSNERKK